MNCMDTSFGHRLAQAPFWDSRHLLVTFSCYPLAGPIFHASKEIALSSNHILLVYIANLITVVSNQCLKRILLHFK